MFYVGVIFALAAGIFIAVQGSINGMMGSEVGVFTTVIVPVVIQIILLSGYLMMNRKLADGFSKIGNNKMFIVFLIIAAILGLGIMVSLISSIMRIGPLLALSIVVFSQLLASMVIENYGWFGATQHYMTNNRILGLIVMLGGVVLFAIK